MATRNIAASDSNGVLHGRRYRRPLQSRTWWQRLLGIRYEGGSLFEMEAVEERGALQAFERAIAGRGRFSIESAFGGRMDFHPTKGGKRAWIDCWFFESELSEVAISVEGARKLVQLLFTECTERDILTFLRSANATLVPPGVVV